MPGNETVIQIAEDHDCQCSRQDGGYQEGPLLAAEHDQQGIGAGWRVGRVAQLHQHDGNTDSSAK